MKKVSTNPLRSVLEQIVLESQVRANKAKFELDIAQKSLDYNNSQIQALERVYDSLHDMFEYIAKMYEANLNDK